MTALNVFLKETTKSHFSTRTRTEIMLAWESSRGKNALRESVTQAHDMGESYKQLLGFLSRALLHGLKAVICQQGGPTRYW